MLYLMTKYKYYIYIIHTEQIHNFDILKYIIKVKVWYL